LSDFFVQFLTRPGCHLCEDARPTVQRAARMTGTRVEDVDITEDPETTVRWDLRIPVVLDPSGRVVAEGRIDLGTFELARRLLAARFGQRPSG
jgi:hypothetical protein